MYDSWHHPHLGRLRNSAIPPGHRESEPAGIPVGLSCSSNKNTPKNPKMKHNIPPQQWKKMLWNPIKNEALPPLLTICSCSMLIMFFLAAKKTSSLARKAFAFERALCHNEVDRCLGGIFVVMKPTENGQRKSGRLERRIKYMVSIIWKYIYIYIWLVW